MFWSFYWQNSIFHFFGMFAVKHSIAISPFKSQITTQKEEQIEKKKNASKNQNTENKLSDNTKLITIFMKWTIDRASAERYKSILNLC